MHYVEYICIVRFAVVCSPQTHIFLPRKEIQFDNGRSSGFPFLPHHLCHSTQSKDFYFIPSNFSTDKQLKLSNFKMKPAAKHEMRIIS